MQDKSNGKMMQFIPLQTGRKFKLANVVEKYLIHTRSTDNVIASSNVKKKVYQHKDKWMRLTASLPQAVFSCMQGDILEDEERNPGVSKSEDFVSKRQESDSERHYNTPSRSLNFNNTIRSRMEEETSQPESLQSEASINLSSKYEELVRSQMHQNTFNGESSSLKQDDLDLGGRRTPVGEDGEKQYQDGHTTVPKSYDPENSTQQVSALYDPLIDGFFENGKIPSQVDQTSLRSDSSQAVIDDVLGNGHTRTPIYSTESPVYSRHSSAHSSTRQTPVNTDIGEATRPESVGSTHSANSTSRHVLDDLINNAMGRDADRSSPAVQQGEGQSVRSTPTRPESVGSAASENSVSRRGVNELLENATKTPPPSRDGSMSGSRPQTPPRLSEQISDVLNPSDRHSPIRREFLAGSPSVSIHSSRASSRNSAQGSATGSQRQTPQKDLISSALRASQEKLYTFQDMRRASGSENGSNAGSRPQSITSEQELSQYCDNVSENRSNVSNDNIGTPGSRTGSASNLPAIGSSPQRYTPDKRSMTPDNHIRVPVVGPIPKSSIGRTPPRTPISNASSRTVTPVNADTEADMRHREQIKDLEITLSSVKKQLTSKELEVMELKDQVTQLKESNTKLQGDLDRQRARASPAIQVNELERKLREANEDKELLRSDILRLEQELKQKSEPGLNNYDPNGRSALQRKIDDLTGQLQDLQEAHESASLEIASSEKKVKQLAADNESLRILNTDQNRAIDEENRNLRAEIKWLRDNASSHNDATDYRLRIELQQVKDDNRNLRERNYQLHDDNIRLKEELSDLRKSFELMGSVKKTLGGEDKKLVPRQYDTYETPAYPEKTHEASYHGDRGYSRRSDPLPERRKEVTKENAYSTRSVYDPRSFDAGRLDQVRKDKSLVDDTFTKSESFRYESYRSGPDGGSSDKYPSSLGYSRTLTPERPSGLRDSMSGPRSQDTLEQRSRTIDKSDLDLVNSRRERSRTSSAEIDFRSMSLSAYNADLSKTTPALSGRSRDITRKQHLPDSRDDYYTTHDSMNMSRSRSRETHDKTADSVPAAYNDDGNMSDTPTDILVNIKPSDKITSHVSWSNRHRQRRGSAGSDGSNSSFSDIDDQITAAVRKRSKSADSREILRRMGPSTGASKENVTLSRTLSPAPTAGLRSITPRPLATQHNKSSLTLSSSLNSLTQGLRPFAPRSAQDLQIEDVIKFSRQGGKLSQGTVKFIGHLPGRGDIYLGVELDKEDGKHDGVFEGIRYFMSKPNKGVFVAYNKVVMAWTSY
ncbi:hypothetical protein ACF0H5_007424 [Mactra antiquata]